MEGRDLSIYLINQKLGPYSSLVAEKGLSSLKALIDFIRMLPYGRNSSRFDLSLVIKENKGTCSSKHAFVAAVAIEQGWEFVKLMMCIYEMSSTNTPGIQQVLQLNKLTLLPEAHCYLRIYGAALDLTFEDSNMARLQASILEEIPITPEQTVQWKVDYHKDYMSKWAANKHPALDWTYLWEVREACIKTLGS